MSITITGGISFSGGVDIVAPPSPPSVATAGWISGGATTSPFTYSSSVYRITYASDTATANTRGPLTVGRFYGAGAGTLTYGWIAGGDSPTSVSSVDRITYATDTATASLRGPLSSTRVKLTATGNTTDGWFGGGQGGNSTVNRITYATDTATASIRGSLSAAYGYAGAATGTTSYGWFGGGYNVAAALLSTVQRIDYANDTAIASIRGPLSSAKYGLAAVTDITYGWYAGGKYNGPGGSGVYSTVDRITFATDTTTASVRGPTSVARYGSAGVTDSTLYGWIAAGTRPGPAGGGTSRVDRITYATDTATASVRGPLSSVAYGLAGTSGIQ